MDKKTAVVTGANSGVGKATAAALADKGMHVVMLCRSAERGKAALDELLMQNPQRSLELMLCDLGSQQSIRRFAEAFNRQHDRLDVLVNCAGVVTMDRRETADGFELGLGVNHLGHFLLTMLLLKVLSRADKGRIVVVASGAHNAGRIHYEDLQLKKGYTVVRSYSQSKLANMLFTRELARRLAEKGSGITVNATCPGPVGSQMGVDRDTGFGKTIMRLLGHVFPTPEEGAETPVFLASDPDVEHTSGEYYRKCRKWPSSKRSRDMDSAKKLWDISEALCGITFEEAMG
jgi:retinol dehydrogenase 14